ncbi:MAG TPA: histidine kinase [Streptosporangiaceae bacterium]|nr:histidine kinase [Streptosporangiaceae bacterium]
MNGISMPRPWQASGLAGQLAQRLDRARRGLRSAVGFVGSPEPRARPTARAIGVDVALAVAAAVALLVLLRRTSTFGPAVMLGPARGLREVPGPSLAGWRQVALATVSTAPLALRRVWPLTAFWLVLSAAALTPGYRETVITVVVVVVAAYSALAYSRFYGAAMLCVPAAGLLITAAFHGTLPELRDSSATLLLLGPILVAGNAMHVWRRQAGDSQARLHRLQAEHEAATRRALDLERARIASELHDVVTHNVSVMIVQAGAARQVLAAAPDQATSAMLAVEASGRAAMTELRNLLGLLGPASTAGQHGTAHEPAPEDGAPAGQELRPQPGLRQLRSLIDGVTAAGLPVDLHIGELPPGLPPGLDLAAFRVAQEALTNVIKHAGKPRTSVSVGCRDGVLVVAVADAGRADGAAAPAIPGAGRGLLGLRERVAMYGGELEAGPRPDGGWLVRARIPADPRPVP